MSAPVTPPVDSVEAAPLSEAQRLTNVFIAPSRTFADLRRSAKFWGPFLIVVIMSYAGAFALQKKITTEELTESIINNMSEKQKARIEAAPPEQQANIRASIGKNTRIFSYAGWVIYSIAILIMAAVLMATFNFGMGKSVGYGTSVAIMFYSLLPSVIRTVLFIITLYAGVDPANFNIQNPVATNPAFFMNANDMPVVYPLLQTLDIFTLWQTVLVGIGFAVVTRSKKSTAIGVVFGWLAVITLFKMGWAAIF